MQAKKSLGQHFLTSEKALTQIVAAGDIHVGDLIVEIGPGKGVLTERLLARADKVIAIEKDRELIPLLQETFRDAVTQGRLEVVERDILKFDPETVRFYNKPYKVIANIPYYITGAIIEQFLSTTRQPERMVLLMQREVAERIVARDGKQSILSIAVAAYGTPRIIDRVPRGAFNPPPSVESAILSIDSIHRAFFTDCDEHLFFAVLKSIFGKKRKQIGKSFGEYLDDKSIAHTILARAGIDPTTRPEDIALNTWKLLVQKIQESGVQ